MSLNLLCKQDPNPNKINLTVGAYRDDSGLPWVLPSVKAAIQDIYTGDYDIEYLSLKGDSEFVDLATDLMFEHSSNGRYIKNEGRLAQVQSLSGSGAVHFLLKFYRDCINPNVTVHIQNPTWPIHSTMASSLGMKEKKVEYYDLKKRKFDRQTAIKNLKNVEPKSLAVIQVCGHNPTGFDLTPDEWSAIIDVFKAKEVDVLLDNPYQGYVSGDIAEDARTIGLFVDSGLNVMFAQSFAKNFGLYSGRVGTMSVICSSREQALQVEDNLAYMIRNTTSTNPKFGSEVIKTILKSPELTSQWHRDLKLMADRIGSMRSLFVREMEALGSQMDWSYVEEQKGMFALTHLDKEAVVRLRNEESVYLIESGRISVAGINTGNVRNLARSIFKITEGN